MSRVRPLTVLLLLGCGAAPPSDHDRSPTLTEPESLPPDESDRCSTLPRECIEGYVAGWDDGCPDGPPPEVAFAPASSVLDEPAERVLEAVSHDGRRLWPGASIRLVAVSPDLAADRIAAIRAGLVARGVPIDLIREGGDAPPRFDGSPRGPDVVVLTADDCASP